MADRNDQKVRRIQQAFQDVRSGLSDLRKALQALMERINADAYVSADSIARLSDILNAYKVQAEKLERAGAELSVPIGKDISEIENAICAFEEQQNNGQIKRLLMDYFRLTADKARLNNQLEGSKRMLMEKCMRLADPTLEALAPYALAVNYVRSDAEELPEDAYTILADAIGDGLTTAVENHLIRYAETFDTTPYFDGSCKLLMPFGDAAEGQSAAETDGDVSKECIDVAANDVAASADESDVEEVIPDAFTAASADVGAAEASAAAPASNGYSGILEDAKVEVEYADNPSADALNVREFKSAVRSIPGIPSVLRWFAEEKLYSQGQAGNSETGCVCANESGAMEYLVREGYIVQVSVRSRLLSGTYYTLSDKGWACYTNRGVEGFLQNAFQNRDCIHYAMLPVPKTMRIEFAGLNGMMAVRMALIHEFFVQTKMNASIIVDPVESCAYGFSIAETGCIVFPAIFNANVDMQKAARDRILPLLGNFASIVLIVPRKTDIALLADALAMDETTGEHVFFSVQENHFDNYDMHSNCLRTINDFAATTGKTQTESVRETENETENETGTKNESVFAAAVKRNNVLLSDEDRIDGLRIDKSPNEGKKVTSSIFISDVRNINENVCKDIIRAIYPCECMSAGMAVTRLSMPANWADFMLEHLYGRGYLRRYTLDGVGRVYCASPRLRKAMQYSDAIRFVGARRMTDTDMEYLETAECVATRIAQLTLEAEALRRFLARKVKRFSSNKGMRPFSCVARIGIEKPARDSEVMICAMWRDTGECDALFERTEELMQESESIARITFASFNIEKARALAKAYLEASAYSDRCNNIWLYSIMERKYESYSEVVDPDADPEAQPDGTGSIEADEADTPVQTDNETEAMEPAMEPVKEPVAESDLHADLDSKTEVENIAAPIGKAEILDNACRMLCDRYDYAATAYLKANVDAFPDLQGTYNLIAYALNDPMARCIYQANTALQMISDRSAFEDILILSISIRTFYSNQNSFDYGVKALYDSIKEYSLMNRFPTLSNVVYELMSFKSEQNKGMDAYAGYRIHSKAELEKKIETVQREAKAYYESVVIGKITEKAKLRRFLETKKMIFSANGDLGTLLKAVADGDRGYLQIAEDFLQRHFIKDGMTVAPETIDDELLWQYIVDYWERAASVVMMKKHEDLKSSLRSNITSSTMKVIQNIAEWCVLQRQADSFEEDDGALAYKKIRKHIEDLLRDTIREIDGEMKRASLSLADCAAVHILQGTLKEISECISGAYSEKTHKYFYAPFLLTDDIMLHEDYLPDLDMHSTMLKQLMPASRILSHVHKRGNAHYTYVDRLHEIMEEQGDDFGAARLISAYLTDMEDAPDAAYSEDAINMSISYARVDAEHRKEDFVGELELAQSYGQIDNSEINKIESILSAIDDWFEWAAESGNFGFFRSVMEAYLADIRESSKPRAAGLLKRLDKYRLMSVSGISAEVKEARIRRIADAIREQKYTVAEDLLGRAAAVEEDVGSGIDEDFLQDFLDNYSDYYRDVAGNGSFENLVNKRTYNKEQRGGKRLAQNWLPGGSAMGRDRLLRLLECFDIKDVTARPDNVGRYESYVVTAIPAAKSKRRSYTHPIAAFGSGIARDGFRVICLNGNYDADNLIDVMKKTGNAKHTLMLVDCALQLSERRRLARKAKNTLEDKLFGVVDRTAMMFFVRNFDETKNARMLMSLIAPFSYYQPYVWESANVMPPEIFMGRKNDLEKIKSSAGVNIVYGGRQLGKSALLKRAMEDVNLNENGDRAVYIEIKGLDYAAAARKIGHELFDQGILPTDIDTEDWEELARHVKRRLRVDDANRIPYLLLLLDEADAFIDSSEKVNYKPFDALKDMQSVGTGRFKFVVAGLRNVVRFKREAALGNNSVLTHLQPLTVKPFTPAEARELLEIPLHYLGLRFPKEKESLITLILATTNYFPGLIQMYCAKLLEAMRNRDYAGYNESDSPAYMVSVDHIKKVLADSEFTRQIWDKYFITLKLDEDDYYYIIALIMAYLYRENGSGDGYSVEDIREVCTQYYIRKIADLTVEKLNAFMEELVELNVLRKSDQHYFFTRYTFFQMMAARIDIDDELTKYMEE